MHSPITVGRARPQRQSREARKHRGFTPDPTKRLCLPGSPQGHCPWNHSFWLGNRRPTEALKCHGWPSPIPQPMDRLQRGQIAKGRPASHAGPHAPMQKRKSGAAHGHGPPQDRADQATAMYGTQPSGGWSACTGTGIDCGGRRRPTSARCIQQRSCLGCGAEVVSCVTHLCCTALLPQCAVGQQVGHSGSKRSWFGFDRRDTVPIPGKPCATCRCPVRGDAYATSPRQS